jgi:predicted transglutaminase-like cysteine proteinase
MENLAARRTGRHFLAGFALVALPTIAAAQSTTLPTSVMTISKSQAILGTTSALDRLLAQQGAPVSVSAAPVTTLFSAASLATYSIPAADLVMPAITHGPIASDRPDFFDSVALAIGWSPLQSRWQRVGHGGPDAPATRFAASLTNRDAFHRLEAVNLYVNRRVRFVEDRVQYGVEDYWAPAAQTLSRGKGDCEDFAIAKIAMLRRAGFAEHDLYLVIVKDLVRRQDHAVAVARADGQFWLLDSGTDELLDASRAHDYRPVMSFSGARSWTHGYRREKHSVTIAQVPQATYQLASISQP